MLPKTPTRTALLFVLSAVSLAAVCYAGVVLKHTCFYDEIHKDSDESNLPKVQYIKAQTTSTKDEWMPMRIKLSTADLTDKTRHCSATSSKVTDVFGATVQCANEDVLTETKKQHLFQFVRAAIVMHATRLKVKPIQHGFKVPKLTAPLCKLLTVPAEHKNNGVADADTILYVTSLPSSKNAMFAAGAPCALLQSDNRPVVGALTYTTKRIAQSEYSIRVATHEIAHALGFTYRMMKDVFNMKILPRMNVRHKSSVTEVQTVTVIQKTKEHYSCWSEIGMELEDEAGILSTPSHSHWERRNALEDLMAGIVTTGKYTSITLAAFEDIGVYKADFDKAELMGWGKNFKCEFLTKRCVGDKMPFSGMFCSDNNNPGMYYCAPGRRALGKCSNLEWDKYAPAQYQYFEYWNLWGYAVGERRLLTDRCPIYEEETDASCTDGHPNANYGIKNPNSWCLRYLGGALDSDFQYKGVCGVMVPFSNQYNHVRTQTARQTEYTKKCEEKEDWFIANFTPTQTSTRYYQCPSSDEVKNAVDFKRQFLQYSAAKDTATPVRPPTPTASLIPHFSSDKAGKDKNTLTQEKPSTTSSSMAAPKTDKKIAKPPSGSEATDAQQALTDMNKNASCAPQANALLFFLIAIMLLLVECA